jgi:hypothetical protein
LVIQRDLFVVQGYDELYLDETRVIGQYESDQKSQYEFLCEFSLPLEFPISVEDDEMEFVVTAAQPQFDAFEATVARTSVGVLGGYLDTSVTTGLRRSA